MLKEIGIKVISNILTIVILITLIIILFMFFKARLTNYVTIAIKQLPFV